MRTSAATRTALSVALGVLVVFGPAFLAAERIPSELSDEAFWRLVEEASEPSGTFISENFVSNERGFQYVIPPVLQRAGAGGVYLGVGPEQNFTYVAALHSKMAFIIDIRRQNMIQHLLYKAVFEMSSDRAEFLSRLFSRKPTKPLTPTSSAQELFEAYDAAMPDPELHARNLQAVKDSLLKEHRFRLSAEDEASLDHVYQMFAAQGTRIGYSLTNGPSLVRAITTTGDILVLTTNGGQQSAFPTYSELMSATDGQGMNWNFLSNEERYRTVRDLERKNMIVPIVGDFAGPKAIRAVGQFLRDRESAVSVFYLSNVEQYLTPAPTLKRFYENVAMLPLNASSTFIRSFQAAGPQPGIAQSTFSPMQDVLEAVIGERVHSQAEILRLFP